MFATYVAFVCETHNLYDTGSNPRRVAEFNLFEAFSFFLLRFVELLFVVFSLVLSKRGFATV